MASCWRLLTLISPLTRTYFTKSHLNDGCILLRFDPIHLQSISHRRRTLAFLIVYISGLQTFHLRRIASGLLGTEAIGDHLGLGLGLHALLLELNRVDCLTRPAQPTSTQLGGGGMGKVEAAAKMVMRAVVVIRQGHDHIAVIVVHQVLERGANSVERKYLRNGLTQLKKNNRRFWGQGMSN